MPHLGHLPGDDDVTSGCMGHVYTDRGRLFRGTCFDMRPFERRRSRGGSLGCGGIRRIVGRL